MNKNGYRIMDVTDGYDSSYGEIIIVKANPIKDLGFGRTVSMTICDETDTFFFPQSEEDLLNQILLIANGDGDWYPNESDFETETVLDENLNKRVPVYRHVSFFDDSYDETLNSGHEVSLIPDIGFKAKTLNNQFYQGYWFNSYSFRGYVEALAEGDDVQNFWGWLFNRPDFNGLKPWELPYDFEREYERFLDVCGELDNY